MTSSPPPSSPAPADPETAAAVAPGSRAAMRSFWSLIVVMFQGAFSDNLYKFALTMWALAVARQLHPGDPIAEGQAGATYKTWLDALFLSPYVFAASGAGWLSDRFRKSRVAQWTKLLEVVAMTLAALAFVANHLWISMAILCLMGIQSTLFSPAKYGILPELVPPTRLAWANGILQGATFLAIILGTLLGPALFGHFKDSLWVIGVILVVLAVIGYFTSRGIAPTPEPAAPEPFRLNPFAPLLRYGRCIAADTGLRWSVVGMTVWWLAAVALQGAAILVANNILQLSPTQVGIALLPICIGLGVGSALTSLLSRDRIELGLVPFGALLMFATCLVVSMATPSIPEMTTLAPGELARLKVLLPLLMGAVGLVCGFVIVPLQSFVVEQSPVESRGGVWATASLISAIGMVLGVALQLVVMKATNSPGAVFLAAGVLMLVAACVMMWRFPTIPLRFFIGCLFQSAYKTRAAGLENIPRTGGALLAPNHQSYLDAILLQSVVDRPIRFVMAQEIYRTWWIWPFARLTNSIPVRPDGPIRELIGALRAAREEVASGGLVCLFPEGQLTRTGQLLPFMRGVNFVMKTLSEPIIPVAIDGAYQSSFAVRQGRAEVNIRPPWQRRELRVVVGKPMPSTTTPVDLRRAVLDLLVDAFAFRKDEAGSLHRLAFTSLRRRWAQKLVADHLTGHFVANWRVLAATIALGRRLKPHWQGQEHVGLLVPPSLGAVSVNIAALFAGTVPVNLNYSASAEVIAQICRTCDIRTIITSRVFLEKVKLDLPPECRLVYLDDIRKEIGGGERLRAILAGLFGSLSKLEQELGRTRPAQMDDVATLIFSSGSTGVPKGVMLTHWNILSNVWGAAQAIEFPKRARLVGILPFFHSFGYTVTLWLPLIQGVGVLYYPNPLDARTIGNLVEEHRLTHLLATPTFLAAYARRIPSAQFASLQLVITGAEKLRASVAAEFRQHFGILPVEGYGATECSPAVSLNSPDVRMPHIYQEGSRAGTVGQPVPGVSVRVIDRETGEILPPETPGMLIVRGPNVMKGYYKMPDKTAEVLKDGWYITGDIARLAPEGWITITDRLSRFSKIGGEMVPHVKIEEMLYDFAGTMEPVLAVAGVPDEKKGERLIVLHALPEAKAREVFEKLAAAGLPPLWMPKWSDFIKVEAIPILGSGKLDLQKLKATALAASAGKG